MICYLLERHVNDLLLLVFFYSEITLAFWLKLPATTTLHICRTFRVLAEDVQSANAFSKLLMFSD